MSSDQDRAASLETVRRFLDSAIQARVEIDRIIGESNRSEPAAPTPFSAALDEAVDAAPGTSPLATRVLTALMQMPDVEFLAMTNKVISRYQHAMDALAPPGVLPASLHPEV